MTEIWKQTVGGYMVSNYGRVKNPKRVNKSGHKRNEKILCDYICPHGYNRINLYIDGKRRNYFVHRLVAEAFVEGYKEGYQVNHKDGNKKNNHAKNLEWVTAGDNQRHAYSMGLKMPKINGENISKKIVQYTLDGEFIKEYPSSKEVERQTGFKRSNICRICRQQRGSAYGYTWRFA